MFVVFRHSFVTLKYTLILRNYIVMVLPSLETAYQNERINMARLRGLKIKVICVIYHITFRVETIHNNLRGLKILLTTPIASGWTFSFFSMHAIPMHTSSQLIFQNVNLNTFVNQTFISCVINYSSLCLFVWFYRKEQAHKRSQYRSHSTEYPMRCSLSTSSSSSSSLGSIASISVASQSSNEMSDDESLSVGSDDEIPIWVHGEQRWISGITADTTCSQLVEALLRNEGINGEPAASSTPLAAATATTTAASAATTTTGAPSSNAEHQYAITERWRRVEQLLDNKTKILKIWKAWGQTKSEVSSHFSISTHYHYCTRSCQLENWCHFFDWVCNSISNTFIWLTHPPKKE